MSFLGKALGPVIGAVGNIIGGSVGNKASRDSQSQANDYNVENYQHRYQWTMQDLKSAGLNPILAATQGGLAGSVNGASALSGSSLDIGGGFAAGMSSSAQARQARTQENIGRSTIALNSASANKFIADAALTKAQTLSTENQNKLFNDTFKFQADLYRQNLENAKKQGEYIDAQRAGQIYNNTVLMPAMAAKATAEGSYANSAAGYQAAQTAYSNELTKGLAYTNTQQQKFGYSPTGSLTGNVLGVSTNLLDRFEDLLQSKFRSSNSRRRSFSKSF